MKLITSALFLLTLSANAATLNLNVNVSSSIEYKIIQSTEACAVTIDYQWSHEEDTRMARTIYDANTYRVDKELRQDGFTQYPIEGEAVCSIDEDVTSFVYIKNPNANPEYSDIYFDRYTTGATLSNEAQKQGVFKVVKRVYVKGIKNFKNKLDASFAREVSNKLNSVK